MVLTARRFGAEAGASRRRLHLVVGVLSLAWAVLHFCSLGHSVLVSHRPQLPAPAGDLAFLVTWGLSWRVQFWVNWSSALFPLIGLALAGWGLVWQSRRSLRWGLVSLVVGLVLWLLHLPGVAAIMAGRAELPPVAFLVKHDISPESFRAGFLRRWVSEVVVVQFLLGGYAVWLWRQLKRMPIGPEEASGPGVEGEPVMDS